jgi:hypothetical protein
MTIGVLVVFLRNFTVTPEGIVTDVKLKMPLRGSVSVVLTVGVKAPSAPVLPLMKADATPGAKHAPAASATAMALAVVFMFALLPSIEGGLKKCFVRMATSYGCTVKVLAGTASERVAPEGVTT